MALPEDDNTVRESINLQDMQLDEKQLKKKVPGFLSVRYGLAIIIHFCLFVTTSQNLSLSIAIVAMVNSTGQSNLTNISRKGQPDVNPDAGVPVYDWSPEIQGIILSSITYGQIITLTPSGYFAGVLGARKIFMIGLFISSVLSFLIPLAAAQGMVYIILTRAAQGMAQGMEFGASPSFWVKWAPPLERSRISSITSSGTILGIFTVLLVGGFICQSLGWPYIFYIFGGIGCVCCVIWFSLVYDDPINHPYISESEKEYITFSLAGENSSPSWSLPINAMIRSLPLWAIIITGFCRFWLVTNLTISLPLLINIMFDFDIRNNGILSALPSVAAWICITLGSQMADFLLSKKILSLVVVRKLFTVLGMLLPSVFITAVPYVSSITAVTLLMLSMGISCLCYSGFMINSLDIAPRYTSFLMGLGGVFTMIPGILSPTVTGYLINQDSVSGWKNVFLLSAAINLAGMIIYVIFGRADIQDWAKEKRLTRF
ncbi:sodium-dependent phosphate transport protein 3-like [Phascolarctos cinereus]|uniref:Sodium-dependent phosphate transport protein 3-like isoform X1 n=1 Tax=Phascolarctos cinereus TaxID=38626 RepID=A0A6P5LSQ1_PHACI|nr:sodium-dependent phosphate transport protein 3-like isoform X1 [Phascolarctos cinereus]